VKGGKNFSFGALVIVGDRNGKVGYGYGKANEVSDAIRKGATRQEEHDQGPPQGDDRPAHGLLEVPRLQDHDPSGLGGNRLDRRRNDARAILSMAGVVDVLAKSLGSSNPANVVKATFKAIEQMRSKSEVLAKRGVEKI
jgi:small subunit ribosomal protein S5